MVLLDPATGTATFLVEVIEVIYQTLKTTWTAQGLTAAQQRAAWNAYVPAHLLPRLYGYELMMAPYAIAHMKIGLKLKETGYDFQSDARVRIYLTNALEPASDGDPQLQFAEFAPALAHEAQAVNEVKRRVTPTIVIGNPPYAGHSANDSAWVAGLLRGVDDKGRSVENYFEVDGHSLNERNPKWLNDDYVKFIRLGQWRIAETGTGILAFITNHGYLDNPTFRGMRQSLMADFERIAVLDLHGSSKKKETTPEGGPDENVFDIMPGVAILLAAKAQALAPRVDHADLYGLRGQKYAALTRQDVTHTAWTHLQPASPFYLFAPQDVALRGEYMEWWKISEIMSVNSMGITTGRDAFATDFVEEELLKRLESLRSNLTDREIREQFDLRDSSSFSLSKARLWAKSKNAADSVIPISYRCFDERYVIYTNAILARNREEVCQHQIGKQNLALVTFRAIRELPWVHVFVSRHSIAKEYVSSLDNCFAFPLHLYFDLAKVTLFDSHLSANTSNDRRPNLAPDFIKAIETQLGLTFVPQQPAPQNPQPTTLGPEDIFHYAYAIFHSPTYRTRYAEFLKIDFPRLPLTSDVGLFRALATLGADLVALHLLEDDYPAASWNLDDRKESPLRHPITTFVEGANGTTMGAFSKSACYQDGRVYLDTSNRARSSYFEGVPEDVWQFHIGGYQVLHKWLYDRRGAKGKPGRTLTPEDIAHYQRIVVALKETIRLMAEIDAVIEAHGGWPVE